MYGKSDVFHEFYDDYNNNFPKPAGIVSQIGEIISKYSQKLLATPCTHTNIQERISPLFPLLEFVCVACCFYSSLQ